MTKFSNLLNLLRPLAKYQGFEIYNINEYLLICDTKKDIIFRTNTSCETLSNNSGFRDFSDLYNYLLLQSSFNRAGNIIIDNKHYIQSMKYRGLVWVENYKFEVFTES